jgi:hypothetical protein
MILKSRLNINDFEVLEVIGRGAFGQVKVNRHGNHNQDINVGCQCVRVCVLCIIIAKKIIIIVSKSLIV